MAVVASGRLGNVASDITEERDVCRGCVVNEEGGPRDRCGFRSSHIYISNS